MDDVTPPMSPFPPDQRADEHDRHDQQLVVAYACADLSGDEVRRGRAAVESCARCAALADDVALLRTSIAHDLPAARRPRDFRLGADDAERLRAGPLSRLLRRLGGPGLSVLQPLAGAAVAIGLVLVVATNTPPGFFLGAGSAAAPVSGVGDQSAHDSGGVRNHGSPAALSPVPGTTEFGPADNGGGTATSEPPKAAFSETVAGPSPALLAGVGLVILGVLVLVIRFLARRMGEDPLLR